MTAEKTLESNHNTKKVTKYDSYKPLSFNVLRPSWDVVMLSYFEDDKECSDDNWEKIYLYPLHY